MPRRPCQSGRHAEQALDAQDVAARRVERKPFAHELRHRIHAAWRRRRLFAVWLARLAVEDEVGPVVHQRRAAVLGGAREASNREGVDGERLGRAILRGVDVVEGRAVDDNRGCRIGHDALDSLGVGHVERRAGVRDDIAIAERARNGAPELPGCTGEEHAAHARCSTIEAY